MKKAILPAVLITFLACGISTALLGHGGDENLWWHSGGMPTALRWQSSDEKLWWPNFLGPQRNGISQEKNLNTDWKKNPPKVLWKVPLGDGFSSFSIVGNRAFTMCGRNKRDIVVCLDATTGKELWTHDVVPTYVDEQKQGPGPRSTPTYHDGKLYCLMGMGELVCLSAADGKRLWTANQFKDTGSPNPAGEYFYWGVTLSPLVEGDLVIVQPGGNKNNSVAAYHKDTGKLVWTAGNDEPGYGSPLTVEIGGRRHLIVPTGKSVLGLDPPTGKVLWRYAFGRDKANTNIASPVWADGLLWISAAYEVGGAVVEIEGQGDKWSVKEKWANKKALQTLFATAMIVDGHIYGCHGDLKVMLMKCVELTTGKVKWEERLDGRQWFLALDGHLLTWSERGTLRLLETQPTQYAVKAELPNLLAYKAWAAPVFADGRLYLRDQRNALCLDMRKQ